MVRVEMLVDPGRPAVSVRQAIGIPGGVVGGVVVVFVHGPHGPAVGGVFAVVGGGHVVIAAVGDGWVLLLEIVHVGGGGVVVVGIGDV